MYVRHAHDITPVKRFVRNLPTLLPDCDLIMETGACSNDLFELGS